MVGVGRLSHVTDLSNLVKAYDVRGVVPDQLDEPIARALGAAFVDVTGAARIVTAHDMRESGPGLPARSPRARCAAAPRSWRPGSRSTDMLYFASGHLGLPGAMFTASHNPAEYNGIKMCRAGRRRDRPGHRPGRDPRPRRAATSTARSRPPSPTRRRRSSRSTCWPTTPPTCAAWSTCRHPAADGGRRRRQRHGRLHRPGGARRRRLPALPLTIVPLYFELDGTFPNHEANPLDPANLVDLQRGSWPRAPTSGSPSTATPTAASSSTTPASRSRRARSPPGREPRAGQGTRERR